jgi:hypothetical protein
MFRSNYSLKISISFLLLIFLIFSTLIACSKKVVEQNTGELFFGIPELIQQEIITEDLSNKEEYKSYISYMEKGPIIPGIFQSAVPQGMAYYEDKDLMLISNYMFDSRPSCITSISMTNGLVEKTLWLLNTDGDPFKGHVGGIAVSKKHLWIASGKGVYYVPLNELINLEDNSNLHLKSYISTAVKASFASYSDGLLWIGEFTSKDGSYTVPKSHHFKSGENTINHAWLAAYILDSDIDMINSENEIDSVSYPDYILSIPDEVQGAVFSNNQIILSQSYGRKNNSRISIYIDPMDSVPSDFIESKNGKLIPVWILGADYLEKEIPAPPMTEGLADYKGTIAVLFESGSDKYRATAKKPQDRIHFLKIIP